MLFGNKTEEDSDVVPRMRENMQKMIEKQHIPKGVVKGSYMSDPDLTGWPISNPKSPYLRRPLKTRRDLKETSGCFPKQDKRTLYLDTVPEDHLTYNSMMLSIRKTDL